MKKYFTSLLEWILVFLIALAIVVAIASPIFITAHVVGKWRCNLIQEINSEQEIKYNAILGCLIKVNGIYISYDELPEVIKELILCVTKTCISNSSKEPIESEFLVLDQKPLKIQCVYCDRIYKLDEIVFKAKEKAKKKVKQRISL